ncbi:NlpC/P60 family protein [Leuconostoc lactis]|uniref:C40 family peptidase n=1 Tax=Leuconostoc lactis TaxID=1246 RepID=UPI002729CB58|nr:C40 family peptidase [Leuconostoc lactis]WKY79767.1 NlpC/P60 family protein [Leuconostoc lactis]
MERIDKQIVASGLGLLSVAGLGTGLAHADTVQRAVNQAVVSLSGQGKVIQTSVTATAPLKIATGKVVASTPTTPQAVVTTKPEIYRVQYGDSLWDIAKAHDVSVAELVANNQGSDLISVGQQLVIPTTQATASPSVVDTQPVAPTITADQTTVSTSASVTIEITTPSDVTVQPAPEQPASTPLVQPNQPTVTESVTRPVTDSATLTTGTTASDAVNLVVSSGNQLRQPTSSTVTQPAENNHQSDVNVDNTSDNVVTDVKPAQSVTLPTTTPTVSNATPVTKPSVVAVAQSLTQQNIPYAWGGDDLAGLDCSGLVRYVFQQAIGKTLPHSSVAQEGYVQKKAVADAKPGDLLFWGTPGASYHVAIYIGNQAYVTAPGPGETVRVETISSAFMPSFAGQF